MTENPARGGARPRRFYKSVRVVEDGETYRVQLDGRTLKTPARVDLMVSSRKVAEAIAAEWDRQQPDIRPETMPLTRLVNVAIDATPGARREMVEELARYAQTDLTCHLADTPLALRAHEEAHWAPLRLWAGQALGVTLIPVTGIAVSRQPDTSLAAVRTYGGGLDDLRLTALVHATALLGSVVIALAFAEGRLEAEAAFAASRIDEDWQSARWGHDEEAELAAARRKADLVALAPVFARDG